MFPSIHGDHQAQALIIYGILSLSKQTLLYLEEQGVPMKDHLFCR